MPSHHRRSRPRPGRLQSRQGRYSPLVVSRIGDALGSVATPPPPSPLRRLGRPPPKVGRLGRPAHPRPARPSQYELFRRKESEFPARFDHLPSTFMDEPVVKMTEEDLIRDVVRAAPGPELDVMGTRPVDRPIAAGEAAALVSCFQCASPRR